MEQAKPFCIRKSSRGCSLTGGFFMQRLDDRSRMSGDVHVRFCESLGVRFPRATRLIMGFEKDSDAERVYRVLAKRFARYGLTIHPEKTRRVPFRRPPSQESSRRGLGTFDFLGMTHYWAKARSGYWVIKRKTAAKRLRRSIQAIGTWCRRNRHQPIQEPTALPETARALCLLWRAG